MLRVTGPPAYFDGVSTAARAGGCVFRGWLPTAPARNLTAAESRPANRRSVAPYNVSADAYRAMVAAVEDDVVDLETLLGRDFGWRATWAAQLAQCDRDGGSCRLSLLPGAVR